MRGTAQRGGRRRVLVGWLGLWALAWLGAAVPGAAAHAAPEPVRLQLFSTVDRTVIPLGVSFILDVEVYASPSTARVTDAFRAADFTPPPGLEVVRVEAIRRDTVVRAGVTVQVLSRRFILRAAHPGAVEVPALRMQVGGRTWATRPHSLYVYPVDDRFFSVGASVLPVVAESEGPFGRRVYVRRGSAFLAAPDVVVTSYHVVMDAQAVYVELPGGRRVQLDRVWVLDPERDVALLHIDPRVAAGAGVRPLPMAPRTRPAAEAVVLTSGWPGGRQISTAGLHYRDVMLQPGEQLWVSSNPVYPGDSGGPLLDRHGRVLGVVSSGTLLRDNPDVLNENLCVATDPRPALWQKLTMARPRGLRAYLRDGDFRTRPHVQALRLSALLSMGYRRLPNLDEIVAELDARIAAQEPADAGLLFLRAAISFSTGTPDDAVATYRDALEAFEGHFPSTYMLALLHLDAGRYDEAARLFRRLRAYPPFEHLADFGLARVYLRQLRYEAAVPLLQAVLQYAPSFGPALYSLALCHLALDDQARAAQVLVRLERADARWAARLQQLLRYPILQPVALKPLPRTVIGRYE